MLVDKGNYSHDLSTQFLYACIVACSTSGAGCAINRPCAVWDARPHPAMSGEGSTARIRVDKGPPCLVSRRLTGYAALRFADLVEACLC